ncbi:probably inactive leucine-rich repeat receptor-like protein kinase At3g28040 [Andrographis paniculata]|uniref:probably inactive leucine-rich repeat receptor-like protein kinase At3g28040 n=1 Tax=Andrographis paniculata TaxID=175694 RepID=UPI0021E8F7DC|nr:probably inactive leucine-rich repeat receptor-like protein kinase At3g28040 [Andrographis paniculata]
MGKERERKALRLLSFILSLTTLAGAVDVAGAGEGIQLNDDVLGLIVFKSGLLDPSKSLDSWTEDDDSPCAWDFVRCTARSRRVSELHLDGLNIAGKIGRGLEKLQSLKILSVSGNNLTGRINPELPLIPGLQTLNLSRNSLSGDVSNLSSSLQILDLSGNSLSGLLAGDVFDGGCSLRYISLSGNQFQGPIPGSLSECMVLNHLNLSGNRFSGGLDFAGIWNLTRLRVLDLSGNALSGPIPAGVARLHNLKELILGGNQFSGAVPGDIGLCPHLTRVDLSNNLLTGEIPESLQRLDSLVFLSLSHNFLAGDFPRWIGKMTALQFIDFSGNDLTGSLPATIGDLKSVRYISLSDNRLSDAIPESMADIAGLSVIRLKGNLFTGSIPEALFDMNLDEVDLSRNNLTGPIPPASDKLFESLQLLDLSGNNLIGDIPAEMGLFGKLKYLNLSWNELESRIPPELGYIQNLTVLDLRSSGLIGMIPPDICDSGSLAILQLDGNSLTGPIPAEIGNCSSLYLLSLSHNNLTGGIPESMSTLRKLKVLKFEENQLSGEIPRDLGRLENLVIANISHNRLVGQLPAGGIFPTLDATAIDGNLGLCSPLLKGPCTLNVPKPLVLDPYEYADQIRRRPDGYSPSHRSFLSVSAIIAISAAALIAVGVVVITLLNASARRRMAFVETALESMCSSSTRSGSIVAGKLILLDPKATSPSLPSPESILDKAAVVGEGVFGTVYKTELEQGNPTTTVAIKKLVAANTLQYQEEFDREIRILGKARHPNLIGVIGYYWTPRLQLVVTDYANCGSLESRLHGPENALTWPERFAVLIGTAKGLAYLHHSFRPPIVHYDIKPSNVLLAGEFSGGGVVPKISDFGLARVLAKLDKHVANNRFRSAPGYVAPEMACRSLRVNEKCDVYGYGVLVLEAVTGRRPVEYGEDNVVVLSEHVRVLLEEGNVLECVDGRMGPYPAEEVLPVLKLALVCTSQIPSSRPSMAEVVQILEVIKAPVPNRTMEEAI